MTTLMHISEIESEEIEVGVEKYRAKCDCDWFSTWFEEFWMAEDASWYHVDYPEGE